MKISARFAAGIGILLLASLMQGTLKAQDCNDARMQFRRLAKTAANDHYTPVLINNIYNNYGNNGDGSFNPFSPDAEGFEWPKGGGEGKTAVFEDGLVWTCYQNGTLKANGSSYWHGLQAGKILTTGTADDPTLPKYRVYRVRPDVGPSTSWSAAMSQKIKSSEGDLIRRDQPSLTDDAIYAQYIKDWNEWPAADGAPYTDVNGNGVYDPSVDIPGVPGADQTLWHVSNDLNTQRTYSMAGSTPIGIEVQRTIWAYNRPGVLGNTIFMRYRLVNKSGGRLDSMYVGQWGDPDLGGAYGSIHDTPACDTTLNLNYVYSGKEVNDGYGFPPPAFGFVLVQGPIVPGVAGDSAITYSGIRKGYRNLPMTSSVFFICGNATYLDPRGTTEFYNCVRGLATKTGAALIDPSTGSPTKFLGSGDPVTGRGWIQPSGSCTDLLSSGPFTLAAGDTQEVVVAATIALGADRIASVTALRSAADQLRSFYRGSSQASSPPSMTATPVIAQGQSTQLALGADCRGLNAKSVTAILRRSDGSIAATVPLFDDGAHGDGQAADGVLGGTVSIPQQSSALTVDADVTYTNSASASWHGLVSPVTTAGPVLITAPVIVSDNLNSDGVANPGEDVRFGFTLMNNSSVSLQNLSVEMISTGNTLSIGNLNALTGFTPKYNAPDATTYFSFTAPTVAADSSVSLSLLIKDLSGNRWTSSVTFPIKLLKNLLVNRTITRLSGSDGGDFDVSVVDPSKTKNHVYHIYGIDSINATRMRGYRLVDSTTGVVLLDNHPLPDPLGHTSPVVDGFKVLLGSVDTVNGGVFALKVTRYAGNPVIPPVNILRTAWSDGRWGFDVAYTTSLATAISSLNWTGLAKHDYELRITPDDNTASEYYLSTQGMSAISTKSAMRLPVQIWDLALNTRLTPRVLPTGGVSRFDTSSQAGSLALTRLGRGIGWYPIYASTLVPYQEPLPQTMPVEDATKTGILYGMVFVDWQGQRYFPPAGTVIRLSSHHALSSADSWSFNPAQILAQTPLPVVPTEFSLSQNYPNPFNPSTMIRFEIAQQGQVRLKIFNVLGQTIATVVDEQKKPGSYSVEWNASGIASGIYFYQLHAGNFIQTKKMVLVK